ncbi:unnamed protein product [Linum trigynum]|uniref:BED-type domain-containing protein n=1 Tax=Linum trigynum TaxID=586398 RepID=A0AAV2CIS0_9ROSI
MDSDNASSQPSVASSNVGSSSTVRSKEDPTWEYAGKIRTEDGKLGNKCKLCARIIKGGGITKVKQHLAVERGQVGPCPQVSHDIREMFKALLKTTTKSTPIARVNADDSEEQGSIGVVQGKSVATTPNFFDPRTSPGAQIGITGMKLVLPR